MPTAARTTPCGLSAASRSKRPSTVSINAPTLAVEAIKTFHTGVSEDFLLRQEQFKEVRDRLLKSASDFYGRLGALLDRNSDPASRRCSGRQTTRWQI